jgi:hypothetical protein
MVTIISLFFFAAYIMLAFTYTLEVVFNKEECIEHWYIALFAFMWCVLIFWIYFPCDLGSKLYKKLK